MLNIFADNFKYNEKNINTSKLHIFDLLDKLVNDNIFKLYDIDLLYLDNANELLIKTFGRLPDNILVLKGSSTIKNFKIDFSKIKISFIIDDIHQCGIIKKERRDSLKYVNRIFGTYAYDFYNKFPKLNYNLIWFPHSARFIIDFNENPNKKIFMPGRLNADIYPGRELLKKLSKKNKYIEILKPNVNYRINKDKLNDNLLFGKKYYKKLSQYLCCFTDDLIPERPYLVAKHFEIMASGSLLLACNPNTKKQFEKLGYKDNIHYISCNLDNMEEKINFILDSKNKDKINQIRKNGYDLVQKQDTWLNRLELIKKYF